MNILTIDTCGPMISLAVSYKNHVYEYALSVGFQHAQRLLPAIDDLFRIVGIVPTDLDLIACTGGPGSFTGLRIGMATARGLSLGLDCPLVLLSSLFVYVQGFLDQHVLAVLDARKQRFYTGLGYQNRLISEEYDADLTQIEHLLQNARQSVLLTGPGAALLYDQLSAKDALILDPYAMRPRAALMLAAAQEKWQTQGACADYEGPYYLRASDAEQHRAALNRENRC